MASNYLQQQRTIKMFISFWVALSIVGEYVHKSYFLSKKPLFCNAIKSFFNKGTEIHLAYCFFCQDKNRNLTKYVLQKVLGKNIKITAKGEESVATAKVGCRVTLVYCL